MRSKLHSQYGDEPPNGRRRRMSKFDSEVSPVRKAADQKVEPPPQVNNCAVET